MKLFATIREVSKYRHQQDYNDKKQAIAFPIKLDFSDPLWPVKGGIGGNYTLFDVDLWYTTHDGKLSKIPMHTLEGV